MLFTPSVIPCSYDAPKLLLLFFIAETGHLDVHRFMAYSPSPAKAQQQTKNYHRPGPRVIIHLTQDLEMTITTLRMGRLLSHHKRRRGVANML